MGIVVNTVRAARDSLSGSAENSEEGCHRGRNSITGLRQRGSQCNYRPFQYSPARSFQYKSPRRQLKREMLRESTSPSGPARMSEGITPEVSLLHDLHTELGEAPTWDERTQRLYFVDINGKKIYSSGEDGSDLFHIDTPETVGTIALTTDDNILLAAMNRSVFPVDIAKRSIGQPIATVPEEHGVDQMRFNDGKASPRGVFVVGRMHLQFADGMPGRFYRLHWDKPTEGRFEELQGPDLCGLPNGIAWDDSIMYHADTFHRTLTAYKTDAKGVPLRPARGQPIRGEVIVRIPESDGGGPDGMCIDRDGNLWVALAEAGALGCYSTKTGEEISKVEVPVKGVTACTFGGAKLNRLFVTSMKEEGDEVSEHWGGVYSVHVPGVLGLAPAYKVKIP